MQVNIETITPEIAAEMLKLNTHNRPMNETHRDKLARDMMNGKWQFNGDPIRMNGNRLLDGQHRLAAVAKTGITIQSVVVRDLPSDVFSTIDCGKNRSASDALSLMGELNARSLGSAVKWVARYKAGNLMSHNVGYTVPEILSFLDRYPGIRRSVAVTKHHTRQMITPSILAACHYLFAEKDMTAADDFVSDLYVGANLGLDSPILILRERLLANATSKAKLRGHYLMALTIKAWNAQRSGKPLKNLRYREDGPMPEKFPVVE